MIKIGDRELVLSETFLVKENQEVNFETEVDGWALEITLVILPSDKNAPTLKWTPVSTNHARIELQGWSNSLGTATQDPVYIGKTDTTKKSIGFAACSHKIGSINRIDFQIYLGGTYE